MITRSRFLASAAGACALAALGAWPRRRGTLYFHANFNRDADTFPGWSIYGSTATTDPTIVRAGSHSVKLSANNANTGGNGSRVDLFKYGLFFNGYERYIGFSVYFPTNMRSQFTSTGWGCMFTEPGYAHGGGFPPIAMYYDPNLSGANSRLQMSTHEPNGDSTTIWSSGAVTHGRWIDITLRIFFHDTSAGWVEMWIDGVKQTFNNSQQRYYHNTLCPGMGDAPGGLLDQNCYRKDGIASNVIIYQDEIKVGSTYAIVQPQKLREKG